VTQLESTSSHPQSLTIQPGMTLAEIATVLGAPSLSRPLRNDSPDSMGAAVHEYAFATPLVIVTDRAGNRHKIANLEVITDSAQRIIRLAENPNPFPSGGASPRQRTVLGSVLQIIEAEIPPNAGARKLTATPLE
jgi:hypothetical protein